MSDQSRPYRKRRRAELEAQTRERITASTVALHGSVGPSRTSVSAIAQHAGVRRSTVYRHFPDEAALFAACTEHWGARNPAPELERWAVIDDPHVRLRTALADLYSYYDRTEPMLSNLIRDEQTVPLVAAHFGAFRDYLAAARDVLLAGRPARGRAGEDVQAAIGHALAFGSWRSLTREQGLDGAEAADLMCRLVATAAQGPSET